MVIGIFAEISKRRICSFGEDTAAVETDRLQIVIYVAGASLNGVGTGIKRFEQMLWGRGEMMGIKFMLGRLIQNIDAYNRRL
jgi:hypothetical protein